jgi:hypothetical protein
MLKIQSIQELLPRLQPDFEEQWKIGGQFGEKRGEGEMRKRAVSWEANGKKVEESIAGSYHLNAILIFVIEKEGVELARQISDQLQSTALYHNQPTHQPYKFSID